MKSAAAEGYCKKSWTYHPHTDTCLKVFDGKRHLDQAEDSCRSERGGPSGNHPGWLVVIPDSETDQFVRGLLAKTQEAYIGLVKVAGGSFTWKSGYLDQLRTGYRGWKSEQRKLVTGYEYNQATISEDGWQISANYQRPYICQQYPAFKRPSMTCPPIEEGQADIQIKCKVEVHDGYGDFKNVSFGTNGSYPALLCQTNSRCIKLLEGFSANISESKSQKILTTIVKYSRTARRNDDQSKWLCEYNFDKAVKSALSVDCIIRTYVVPHSLNCSHRISSSHGFTISCDVRGVYPEAAATWLYFLDGNKISEEQIQGKHETYQKGGSVLYHSYFEIHITGVANAMPSQHKIEVTVYPNVSFKNMEKRVKASLTRTIEFSISLPHQPPTFSTENGSAIIQGRLTVFSGQTVSLFCDVEGGYPPLYDTNIICDNAIQDSSGNNNWHSPGQRVQAVLLVTRAMDEKMCNCSAKHVSGQYKKQASMTFNVLHAAEITGLTVKEQTKRGVGGLEDFSVKLWCSAFGNPKPDLQIYKLHRDSRMGRALNQTVDTNIELNMFQASCDTSGTYVCAAKNNLSTETSERRVDVRVKCRPQPCSESYSDREFSVRPGTQFEVTLCVLANPEPYRDVRLRPMGGSEYADGLFTAKFVPSTLFETEGNVFVNMSSSITKHGKFEILLNQGSYWYSIAFSLVPYQKPVCPESLNIEQEGSSFVVLSWTPAPDRRIAQTFTVSQIDDEGKIVFSSHVDDIGDPQIFYNITELNPGSKYRFKLSATNSEGLIDCSQLVANTKTHALKDYSEKSISNSMKGFTFNYQVYFMVIAFLVLTVVMVLFIAMVKIKRRKMRSQRSMQTLNNGQNLPLTCDDEEVMAAIETDVNPTHQTINNNPAVFMPGADLGYIEMSAIWCDEPVEDQSKIAFADVHVEMMFSTPQTSIEGDAGYIEMRDVLCDKHAQHQAKIAIESTRVGGSNTAGEHMGVSNVGDGIKCKPQSSINSVVRKEYNDRSSSKQYINTSVNKRHASSNAGKHYVDGSDNKGYVNACSIKTKECADPSANKGYVNACSTIIKECAYPSSNEGYVNACASVNFNEECAYANAYTE
ncbi:basement membrane-specific heparan sulfate proteoglycan core protein-like [Plakobranchus ocellatus]|uniref:Basement membrane-specific heparan sulfate proteoglycan core protein-like n=1 Tax=Plakobranchus ocellatus TaxID=259542 RepID=A0AAV4API4_9GAST|nr:basement membrane-specific heparan sulfate proteoglycan core protein-like [Plakobranchus ocellatus]